jgi:hypothetical protein
MEEKEENDVEKEGNVEDKKEVKKEVKEAKKDVVKEVKKDVVKEVKKDVVKEVKKDVKEVEEVKKEIPEKKKEVKEVKSLIEKDEVPDVSTDRNLPGPIEDIIKGAETGLENLGILQPPQPTGENLPISKLSPNFVAQQFGIMDDFSLTGILALTVRTLHIIGLVVSYALIYFSAFESDPYGYIHIDTAVPPPGDCCNCASFILPEKAWYFIVFAFLLLVQFYGLWSLSEGVRQTLRTSIFYIVRIIIIVIYGLMLLAMLFLLITCNLSTFWFNPCNDVLWPCAQTNDSSTLSTCFTETCPSSLPMDPLLLGVYPLYWKTIIVVAASLIVEIIALFFHEKHRDAKLAVIKLIPKDFNKRARQYNIFVIVVIIIATISLAGYPVLYSFFAADIIPYTYGYDFSAPAPGILVDNSWSLTWVFMLLFALPLLVTSFVLYLLYPIYALTYKDIARWIVLGSIIYRGLLLIAALVFFLLDLTTVFPLPEVRTAYFMAMTIIMLVQLVLDVVMIAILLQLVKLTTLALERSGEIARTYEIARVAAGGVMNIK